MSEERIKVETAFLELYAVIDIKTRKEAQTTSPTIYVSVGESASQSYYMTIGQPQLIPVPAGKVKVSARYGMITTPERVFDIKTGEVKQIIFEFGKGG